MTNSYLARLRLEVESQPDALREFSTSRLVRAPRGSLFVGAGDSYAAALAAFYLSRGSCIALDPYSLVASPGMATGREVFLISVSGRTSANIAAARMVRGLATRTTALTANEASPLAASTDSVVKLPFAPSRRSPGLSSFTLSLLAALKIATGEFPIDLGRVFRAAVRDCEKVCFGRGTTYFLGNAAGYAAAGYAAAKTYEILGSKSAAEMLEEFSHMELFCLRRSDSINIFSCFDPLGKAKKLQKHLSEGGYEARLIPSRGSSEVEQLFHSVFVAQLATIMTAETRRFSRPSFQIASDRLGISDAMIYDPADK